MFTSVFKRFRKPYVNYAQVKQLADIITVANWLRIKVVNGNGPCPHASDKRAISFNPAWPHKDGSIGKFDCWACQKRGDTNATGDVLELICHVRGYTGHDRSLKAALEMQERFTGYVPKAVERKLPPDGLDYLEYDHVDVQALGLTIEAATRLGIGYARKGTLAGRVLMPIRTREGKLLGYAGFCADKNPILKLPSNLNDPDL